MNRRMLTKLLSLLIILILLGTACTGASGTDGETTVISAAQSGSGADSAGGQSLKIFGLYNNYRLRLAIDQFKRKNPGVDVEFEVINEDDGLTYEDILIRLNTEILAGTGPDILVLDGLPLDSYEQQQLLLDLSGLVDTSGIYENLLEGFETDRGLFAIPTGVQLTTLLSKEPLPADFSLDTLVDLLMQDNIDPSKMHGAQLGVTTYEDAERPALFFWDYPDVLLTLWNTCGAGLVQDGAVDREAMRAFFSTFQAICQKLQITGYSLPAQQAFGTVADMGLNSFHTTHAPESFAYFVKWSRYGIASLGNMHNIVQAQNPWLQIDFLVDHAEFAPFPGLTPGAWTPVGMLGVSALSPNRDLATRFIDMVLSDGVQGDIARSPLGVSREGLPVTRSAGSAQFEELVAKIEKYHEVELDQRNVYEELVAGLHTPLVLDDYVRTAVEDAAAALCAGSLDVDGAVNRVAQNLDIYFQERVR